MTGVKSNIDTDNYLHVKLYIAHRSTRDPGCIRSSLCSEPIHQIQQLDRQPETLIYEAQRPLFCFTVQFKSDCVAKGAKSEPWLQIKVE